MGWNKRVEVSGVKNSSRRFTFYFALLALLLTSASPPQPAISNPKSKIPNPQLLITNSPPSPKPFGLPFADPPGPSTWLLGQSYGNTTNAYRQRRETYGAGQGVHFGLDLSAACGTPIVAIGDGVVSKVDSMSHGAAPHNLMIDHGNGYASFYGHLIERARLTVGQEVKRGEVVAHVGDPDLTCTSRPHLHLEIRDEVEYRQLYNPILFIEADWDSLALIGAFGRGFERDLDNPRQWQFLDDQPEVSLWQPLWNDYARPWPPEWR